LADDFLAVVFFAVVFFAVVFFAVVFFAVVFFAVVFFAVVFFAVVFFAVVFFAAEAPAAVDFASVGAFAVVFFAVVFFAVVPVVVGALEGSVVVREGDAGALGDGAVPAGALASLLVADLGSPSQAGRSPTDNATGFCALCGCSPPGTT
jgi:hypothetical protein